MTLVFSDDWASAAQFNVATNAAAETVARQFIVILPRPPRVSSERTRGIFSQAMVRHYRRGSKTAHFVRRQQQRMAVTKAARSRQHLRPHSARSGSRGC